MALQCNIDRRGRLARGVAGGVSLVGAAAAALLWAWPAQSTAGWIIVGLLTLLAGIGLFQASVGWCAARAMGMKTPL